jgi:PAS domain S-box-containing protein
MGQRGIVTGLRADGREFRALAAISRVELPRIPGARAADARSAGARPARRFFTAMLWDLSEEQSLRHQIDALNQHMRTVFELAPVAIWITDAGRIVFANVACAELFGAARREQLIGRPIDALMAPESLPAVHALVARALAEDRPVPAVHERVVRLDGGARDVVIAVAALPDHGRTTVQMVITDITERAEERRELERSRRELRQLSANMVIAREDERRRIARELHDELGQRLTALKMELASLDTSAPGAARSGRIDAMLEMVDDTVASVRRIATELRPLMLDDLGLNAAIEWLAHGWAARMGVKVRLKLEPVDPDVGDAAAIALYRMVQEALTNIARHAHAHQVRIELRQAGGELRLTVQDDGVGFGEASMYREGSHGLMGIRERAYMLGGQLEIGNARGGGGRIRVRLPLRPAAPYAEELRP